MFEMHTMYVWAQNIRSVCAADTRCDVLPCSDLVLAQETEAEWESGDVEAARQKRQAAVKGLVAEAFRLSTQRAE